MLEFYSVHRCRSSRLPMSSPFDAVRAFAARVSLAIAAMSGALVAGCATTRRRAASRARPPRPTAPRRRRPSNVEPPPPAVNLSGFPLPYRQGYADGCASATRRRAQGRRALRRRRQLSHRLAGRPRALSQEMTRAIALRGATAPIEALAVASRRAARSRAPRADVGRSRRAEALPAARLDGRRRVVPVPGRRARARLARDRAGPARLRRAANGSRRATGSPTTSPTSRRCVDAFAPGETVDLVGHSLGGNVVMHYAGVRPARVRALVSLDGFGIPAESPDVAPEKIRRVARRAREPPEFAPYASLDAVADRLQKNNPRLAARQGGLSRRATGPRCCRTAARASCPTRATSCRFRRSTGSRRRIAIWRNIAAPTLWVAAADSNIPRWLDDHPRRRGAAPTASTASAAASRTSPTAGSSIIADAGHMLHHDQPAAVAAAIETFLGECDGRAMTSRCLGVRARRGAYVALVVLTLDLGQQLGRDEAGARARASGRLQRRADVDRRARAVRRRSSRRASRCCPRIVARGRRHRFLPDDDQLRVDDDGAGRRRRRPHVGARVHDAVLDAADRVAGAARARARHAVDRDRRRASPGSCSSSSRGTGRAISRRGCGRSLSGFGWAAGTVATKYFQQRQRARHAEFHRVADADRRAAADAAAARSSTSRRRSGASRRRAAADSRRRGLDRARLPAVDRRSCATCRRAPRRSTCSPFR